METIDNNIIITKNLKTIHNVCMDTLENQKMISIIGPTGYGKTTGVITFQKKNRDNVIVIKASKSSNASIFYSSMYNSIGDSSHKPNLHRYYAIRMAARAFTSKKKKMLLIIDEANKFSPSMLEYLHEFRDLTRNNTGIILSGTMEFKTNIEKWKDSGKSGIPEFYGRINTFKTLFEPSDDEIVSILREYGIHDRAFEKECKDNVIDFRDLTSRAKNYLALMAVEQ